MGTAGWWGHKATGVQLLLTTGWWRSLHVRCDRTREGLWWTSAGRICLMNEWTASGKHIRKQGSWRGNACVWWKRIFRYRWNVKLSKPKVYTGNSDFIFNLSTFPVCLFHGESYFINDDFLRINLFLLADNPLNYVLSDIKNIYLY